MAAENPIQEKPVEWDYDFILSTPFQQFIDLIPEAVIISNTGGQVIRTNQHAQLIFQYTPQEFLTRVIEDLVSQDIREHHVGLRQWFFDNPRPRLLSDRNYTLSAMRKNQEIFPIESSLFALHTNQGSLAINIMRDVSKQKAHLEKSSALSFLDELTNLPNRRYFHDNLRRNLEKAKRYGLGIGILFIDLDHFKPVNDTYGHHVGDALLQQVGERFQSAIRESDFLGRTGGDEFIITLYPLPTAHESTVVAQHIIDACEAPFSVGDLTLSISASIGIAYYATVPRDMDNQTIIAEADQKMYTAKANGGGQYHI